MSSRSRQARSPLPPKQPRRFAAPLSLASLIILVGLLALLTGDEETAIVAAVATVLVAAIAMLAISSGYEARSERLAWGLVGGAMLLYALGLTFLYQPEDPQLHITDPANLLRLFLYPAVAVAVATFFLRRPGGALRSTAIALDAAIFSLALGAIGFELLFDWFAPIGSVSDGRSSLLALPLLDLAALVSITLVGGPTRGRSAAYVILAGSLLALAAADTSLAVAPEAQLAGSFAVVAWPLGVLGVSAALIAGASERQPQPLDGVWLYALTTLAVATSLALLLIEATGEREVAMMAITSLVLCLALLRFAVLAREQQRLAEDSEHILEAAGEGIYRVDLNGRITHVNPATLRMLGYAEAEMLGREAHGLFHHTRVNGTSYPREDCPVCHSFRHGTTQRITGETYWRRDRSSFPVAYTSAPIRDGGRTVGAVVVFDDLSQQLQLEERVRLQASHDSLTGLHNRTHLEHELLDQSRYVGRYGRPGALLLVDLDGFELVNDSLGHSGGDRLLREVAVALIGTAPEGSLVARVGGDEFGVLLRECDADGAVDVGKRLIAAIREGVAPPIGASVGVAVIDGSGCDGDVLVGAAAALREAKRSGGGSVLVSRGARGRRVTLLEQLREAIAEGRLVVFSQPIFEVRTNQMAVEELLVRMVDPNGRIVPPESFLPVAERFGLVQEIDYFVLCQALELVREGRTVAVNLSASSLGDARVVARIEAAAEQGLDTRQLTFEITETSAVSNLVEARGFAARVRELGCTLALDDFGTGFSSFAYLKNLPAQVLKIDMEFIRELPRSEADQELVGAIVAVAESLGLQTVAEGVEDGATLGMVRELGIDFAQGHHLGRPQPVRRRIASGGGGGGGALVAPLSTRGTVPGGGAPRPAR